MAAYSLFMMVTTRVSRCSTGKSTSMSKSTSKSEI